MPEWWPVVVFGWPAVVVSMALAIAGIVTRRPSWLLLSALVAVPFSYYLSGAESRVALGGPIVLLTLVGGAYAVKRGQLLVAWCSLIPFAGVATWLAVSVAFA